MGGLSVHRVAEADPDEFAAIVAEKPAIHRFPGAMAKRLQVLAQHLVENYDGQAELIWTRGEPDGAEVLHRLKGLPGFGEQKAKIFLALLGKQFGVTPEGWRE
ncbi:Fe-S cluster assembly protein HesB, partial [Saccharothrix sp. MB29]|nr:Fe-S cluster assembly protein HesB [Saccharothrix sp. MB29]